MDYRPIALSPAPLAPAQRLTPLRPRPIFTPAAPVAYRERRLALDLSRGGVALVYSTRVEGGPWPTPARRRGALATRLLTALAFGAGAAGVLAVGATARAPIIPAANYALRLPMPIASAVGEIAPAVAPAPAAHLRFAPARARRTASAAPAALVKRARAADEEAGLGTAPGKDRAIARAIATGSFQQWDDGAGARGFVVVGPSERSDGESCRSIAVLTRDDIGGDDVSSARQCKPAR